MTREEAIDVLKYNYPSTCFTDLCDAVDIAIKALSAQPERKTGEWINHRNDDGHNIADCNQCGNAIQWFDGDEIPRYCCMCGAKMEMEVEEG